MRKLTTAVAVITSAVALLASPAGATADNSPLNNFSDGSGVGRGAHTTIKRSADSLSVSIHDRNLIPGHAYTVWAVIFNTPGGCSDGMCNEDDLFNPDAHATVMWSGIGGVANGGGNLNDEATISEGNPQGHRQLLSDLGAPDAGFTDAEAAELHLVVRDHGPVTGNPDQLTTFEGDCTPESSFGLGSGTFECVDAHFSVHQP